MPKLFGIRFFTISFLQFEAKKVLKSNLPDFKMKAMLLPIFAKYLQCLYEFFNWKICFLEESNDSDLKITMAALWAHIFWKLPWLIDFSLCSRHYYQWKEIKTT